MNANIKRNMTISGFCKPLSMIVNYMYIPIVLNYLGVEKYGIWSTILSILSWISYFDIGIGNGLRNKLTESLHNKDGQEKKLVSSAYVFVSIIMLIIAIIFSIFALLTNWNYVFGTDNTDENLNLVIMLCGLFIAINFILSICNNILYALQKAAIVSIIGLLIQICNLGGVLLANFFLKSNLLIMSLVYGISMVSIHFLANCYIFKSNNNLKPTFKDFSLMTGKELVNIGLQFFVIQVCVLVLFTSDNLIISILYGAADVTPYSTVNKLFNVIIGVYSALITPIWSAITKEKVKGNYTVIRETIRRLRFSMIPFLLFNLILMALFRDISFLWLGRNLEYRSGLIFFGGIYCILNIWTNTHGSIANGLGILREQIAMSIIQAVINIPLSLLFAIIFQLGVTGILIGTDISLLVSCIWLPVIIKKRISDR